VVEVLGRTAAVLAAMSIPREHGPARERGGRTEWHADEVHEADDRRNGHRPAFRAKFGAVAVDDLGLLLEDQYDGAAGRHDAQRLETGVEQERPGHA
jgi:hypothetical protein